MTNAYDSRRRQNAVKRASKGWRSSLINVSGANRMLYYRDLKVGTLDLAGATQGGVSELLAGQTVKIGRLFPASVSALGAAKSLKAIATKARVFAEEFGIQVTYVSSGFASWDPEAISGTTNEQEDPEAESDATPRKRSRPNAPVLLRELTLSPRPGTVDGFDLAVTSEAQLNPVLLHYLSAQFGVHLDEADILEQGADDQEVFDLLTKACAETLADFQVTPRLLIGNLFYAEQPLVEDLQEDQSGFLAESDLISALAGDDAAAEAVRSAGGTVNERDPDFSAPSDEHLILDADGSQCYAINAIVAGQNLVIQGPPGTGKSQTIANAITSLAAQGKTVLFVAQKRAAITAVLKRLDQVGLRDIVLDLFTVGGSRKGVVNEVGQALESRKTAVRPKMDSLHRKLEDNRDLLVAADEALHEPRAPWGLPLLGQPIRESEEAQYGLYDWAVDTFREGDPEIRLALSDLERWDEQTHAAARESIGEYVELGGTADWSLSPGWSRATLSTIEQVISGEDIAHRLLATLLPALAAASEQFASSIAVTPASLHRPERLARAITLARETDEVITAGAGHLLDPDTPLDQLADWRWAVMNKRERKLEPRDIGWSARRKTVKAAHKSLAIEDTATLRALIETILRLRASWPAEVGANAPNSSVLTWQQASDALTATTAALSALQPSLQGFELNGLTTDELPELLRKLVADPLRKRLPRLSELRQRLSASGCTPVVEELEGQRCDDPERASAALTHAFAMTLIEHVERTDKRLYGIDGGTRERAQRAFAEADIEARTKNAQRVRRTVAERLVEVLDGQPQQSELIRDQVRRKRGFKPLRALMTEAPDVFLAAKPVWAASPQDVSKLIPAERLFDVVIFDEASQVLPAAAIPAIARASQCVVAGDSLQLPPTTLFTRTVQGLYEDDDDILDDEEDVPTGLVMSDMESILDAVETKLGPQRSRHLAWHYRSRDEKLIATSNTWVYKPRGRQMTTFPAADSADALTHLVVAPSTGLGVNNKSPVLEVQTVVDAILGHARSFPHESLGVIAFGVEHANRIEKELERRLTEVDEKLRAWFAPQGDEPFFIKNIERVQGDEREVVLLTVGYAKGKDGRLRYSWGPVLQNDGHRRVNVAISRSRSRMQLVTSFADSEVDAQASEAEGFQLMRRFITFAATRGQDFGDTGEQAVELNPFEFDIHRRLLAAGLDSVPQYGVGGYRLDFAIRHPKHRNRFVLAVEADGAAYHSGLIARERDRLRQEILEQRGWNFVRIWSTDYFRAPDAEIARVVAAYQEALAAEKTRTKAQPPAPAATFEVERAPRRTAAPNVTVGLRINDYFDEDLDAVTSWVLSDDVPLTRDEVYEAVKSYLGFSRNGKNIVDRIYASIDRCS